MAAVVMAPVEPSVSPSVRARSEPPALRGSAAYEWLNPQHPHHHALCVDCGAEVEIAPRLLERFGRAVKAESRFTPFLDHLALVGRCAACEGQTSSR